MFINSLTSDFNRNFFNQIMTNIRMPVNTGSVTQCWKVSLKVDLVNKITVARNGARNFATKIYSSIEGLFNRFNGKIRMSPIDNFEKSNLLLYPTFRYIYKGIDYILSEIFAHYRLVVELIP